VTALEPGRVKEVVDSLALAAGNLEPSTAIELLLQEAEAQQHTEGIPIAAALKQSFDDQQVALLLARALSSPGQATDRLAKVLDTLAPDDQRKKRILTLAKKLISERDFGVCDVFDALRSNRVYRAGLATDRIKHIMGQQDSTGVQPDAAAALRQPDGALPHRHAGASQHGRVGGGGRRPIRTIRSGRRLNYSRTARVRNWRRHC
jgi:hypothetical protein